MRGDRDKLKTQWFLYFHSDQTTVGSGDWCTGLCQQCGFMVTLNFYEWGLKLRLRHGILVNASFSYRGILLKSPHSLYFLLIPEMSHFAKDPWSFLIDPERISDFPVHSRAAYPGLPLHRCLFWITDWQARLVSSLSCIHNQKTQIKWHEKKRVKMYNARIENHTIWVS